MKIYYVFINNHFFPEAFIKYEDAERFRNQYLSGGSSEVPLIYEAYLWDSFDHYNNYRKGIIDLAKNLQTHDFRPDFLKDHANNEND